jgi:hypothetical protein
MFLIIETEYDSVEDHNFARTNLKFKTSIAKIELDNPDITIVNVDNLKMWDICTGKWNDVEIT